MFHTQRGRFLENAVREGMGADTNAMFKRHLDREYKDPDHV